jgi:DNA-directed RNA polymerase specialized sigma24 family protein
MVDPAHPLDVRPGDEGAVDEVEAWFLEYQATRDPAQVDAELVAEALEAIDTRRHLSLDQPVPDLLDGLGELERQAVVLRFFQDLKQKQIGTELGYSRCTSPGCCAGPCARWSGSAPPARRWTRAGRR